MRSINKEEIDAIVEKFKIDKEKVFLKENYMNLTQIPTYFGYKSYEYVITHWLQKETTIDLLDRWEKKNNPKYKTEEFEKLKKKLLEKKKEQKECFIINDWINKLNGISIKKEKKNNILVKNQVAYFFLVELNEKDPYHSWDKYYELLKEYKQEFGHVLVPESYIYKNKKLGHWLRNQREKFKFQKLKKERIEKLEQIGMAWDFYEYKWNYMINVLEEFYKTHGNINIPTQYKIKFLNKETNLYAWIIKQRSMKNTLPIEKIEKLNNLHFNWESMEEQIEKSWNRGYHHAKNFYQRNGHLRVQEAYINEENFHLGAWIRSQREKYKYNKCTKKQIQLLEKIGMYWTSFDQVQTSFDEQAIYYYLKKHFKDTLNKDRKIIGVEIDVLIPSLNIGIEYDGPRHHTKERDLKKNERCRNKIFLIRVRDKRLPIIEKENDQVLYINLTDTFQIEDAIIEIYKIINTKFHKNLNSEEINIEKDRQKIYDQMSSYVDYSWSRKYEECKKYYEINKNIDIPYGYMVNGYNLGSWVQEQRKAYRLKRLSSQKIQELEKLEIKWKYKETVWMNQYTKFKNYIKENNTTTIKKEENNSLYHWINDQKRLYRRGKLDKRKINLLQDLGVVFEYSNEYHFNHMYNELIKFKEKHHHLIVPRKYKIKEGIRLGLWAERIRMEMKKESYPLDRKKKLLEIGFPLDNKKARFDNWLNLFSKYKEKYHTLEIKEDFKFEEKNLGKWVHKRKYDWKQGALSKEQIEKLKNWGINWDEK